MDVSRINAIMPSQIDWRKLTANEIIRYDNQGIEVPVQYLQWAKEFLQDITNADNDDTTYEMATSLTVAGNETQNNPTNESQEANEDFSAQGKRQQMEQNGESLFGIAKTFRAESRNRQSQSNDGIGIVSGIENSSNNEIEVLDTYMKDVLSKVGEIKGEIDNSKSDIQKVLGLQRQLKTLGSTAQSMLAGTNFVLNSYADEINNELDISASTIDYGSETVNIGNQLFRRYSIIGMALGSLTIQTGDNAVDSGENLQNVSFEGTDVNNSNIDKLFEFKNEVTSQTGVAQAPETNENSQDENNDDTNKNDPANPNYINDPASASLEQILQAKIRRGEDVNT